MSSPHSFIKCFAVYFSCALLLQLRQHFSYLARLGSHFSNTHKMFHYIFLQSVFFIVANFCHHFNIQCQFFPDSNESDVVCRDMWNRFGNSTSSPTKLASIYVYTQDYVSMLILIYWNLRGVSMIFNQLSRPLWASHCGYIFNFFMIKFRQIGQLLSLPAHPKQLIRWPHGRKTVLASLSRQTLQDRSFRSCSFSSKILWTSENTSILNRSLEIIFTKRYAG